MSQKNLAWHTDFPLETDQFEKLTVWWRNGKRERWNRGLDIQGPYKLQCGPMVNANDLQMCKWDPGSKLYWQSLSSWWLYLVMLRVMNVPISMSKFGITPIVRNPPLIFSSWLGIHEKHFLHFFNLSTVLMLVGFSDLKAILLLHLFINAQVGSGCLKQLFPDAELMLYWEV